jgi:NAD(P)-dependent dehydrogenase (short-subunit alcohol dehydrogenase family)
MKVIITGANKGLGFHLVEVFVMQGHQVLAGVYGGEDITRIQRLASTCKEFVKLVPMDVSDEGSVQTAAEAAGKNFGPADLLIHNAGVLLPGDRKDTICQLSMEELRKTLEINTMGTVIVMKYFIPMIRTDGHGTMFFITSEAGTLSNSGPDFPAYSISKVAANKAVFILKATFHDKYKIYAVHPGRMNTDMGRSTAQIEPGEAAESIYKMATGKIAMDGEPTGFINYKGEAMPL